MNLLGPRAHDRGHPDEGWVCHWLAASHRLFSRAGLGLSSSASVALGFDTPLGGCPCAWALLVWEPVDAGKPDPKPSFISQSVPSSPFHKSSGPCLRAFLSLLLEDGIGQNRLGIGQTHLQYAGQTPSRWDDSHHLLSVEVASLKLVILGQSSSAEVPRVMEACQGGRLARINRALCCHQREMSLQPPACLKSL